MHEPNLKKHLMLVRAIARTLQMKSTTMVKMDPCKAKSPEAVNAKLANLPDIET